MKPTTLVFIHRSHSWYLYFTVKQARATNPRARIVVITDTPQPEIRPYAEVLPLSDYWSSAQTFAGAYRHLSYNSYEFELFCFQRWFILAEFIRQHQPAQLVHLDSDILVYDELAADFARLADADLALVGYQGPFSLFLPRPALIPEFCDHITHLFTHEVDELTRLYHEWKKTTEYTAVSDMHALHTFVKKRNLRALDLGQTHQNTAYDNVVHEPDGYAHANGVKTLTWRNRQPYAQHLATHSKVRLKTLHCQGPSKNRVLDYFQARDFGYYRDKFFQKLRAKFGKK